MLKYARQKDLTGIVLGMAKVVNHMSLSGVKELGGDWRLELFHPLLEGYSDAFGTFANTRVEQQYLQHYDARCLSNMAHAYSLVDCIPIFYDGSTLFDQIAWYATMCIRTFTPQGLSCLLGSYARLVERIVHGDLFYAVANDVIKARDLQLFESLSHIVWAFAKAGADCNHLFDFVAEFLITRDLHDFGEKELKNVVWAYATAGINHPSLVEKVANHLTTMNELQSFQPQHLSNIVWAYATIESIGEQTQQLFGLVAAAIIGRDLGEFKPQELSIVVWSYATAGISNSHLFTKVADEVIARENLNEFESQNLANMVWAFAKVDDRNPTLFAKVADAVLGRDMELFQPQDLSTIAWAYTSLREDNPKLFHGIADAATATQSYFDSRGVATLLWAFAAGGHLDGRLFASFTSAVFGCLEGCTAHEVAIIAWSYAVADVNAPELFDQWFIRYLLGSEVEFGDSELCQLHQWQLWQMEIGSDKSLPPVFREHCFKTFAFQRVSISEFQQDVVSELCNIGLSPDEEKVMPSGYSLGALLEVNGKKVGIEVDGPAHYIGRAPMGKTIIKWRQVYSLDRIRIVSVPYYEWGQFEDSDAKQQYLREKLGLSG